MRVAPGWSVWNLNGHYLLRHAEHAVNFSDAQPMQYLCSGH